MNRGIIGILEKPIDRFYLEQILKKAQTIRKQNEMYRQFKNLAVEVDTLSHQEIVDRLKKVSKLTV